MKKYVENIAILFSDFGPYHVARIRSLSHELSKHGKKLIAFRFTEKSSEYGWISTIPEGVDVVTLGKRYPKGILGSLIVSFRFYKEVTKLGVGAAFLPSYSPLPNFLCLCWVKFAGAAAIIMNESWSGTERAGLFGRFMKRFAIGLFDAGLVGGTPQKDYLCGYGLSSEKVFLGYDVVDVEYFIRESSKWRVNRDSERLVLNLPSRYFLSLGRFIPKKNLGLIINAYAHLSSKNPSHDISLVFVGEGPEEEELRKLAERLSLPVREGIDYSDVGSGKPEVVFYPFQQVEYTPLFFSFSECFILPSLYEEWGLVVNEAMASGTSVLVSNRVGSSFDLVKEGENGYCFSPVNVMELLDCMQRFIDDPSLGSRMGSAGQEMIKKWGPGRFSGGAIDALIAAGVVSPGVRR